MESVSRKEFAEQQGVASSTVRNWILRRQIYGAALLADGKINAVLARRQLAARRDASRGRPPKSRAQEAEIAEPPPDDPLFQLRLEKERLEIRRREVALDITLGRYVLADEVRANRRRALAEIVQMTEAWLPTLISELGLGKKELDVARASYHAVRERQVAAMGEG